VGGFSRADAPLFGGLLVPFPDIMIFGIPVDPAGELSLQATLDAAGLPPGQDLYFQLWIGDPAASGGYAASNGLRATAP
jgi:hypothetical protein